LDEIRILKIDCDRRKEEEEKSENVVPVKRTKQDQCKRKTLQSRNI
jgi:hypothetical protein